MATGISGLYKKTYGASHNPYWDDIPVGKENAVTYEKLCNLWHCDARTARYILHDLSALDNGDNYILIRSSKNKGFYKTDDETEIQAYKRECLNKGRSIFAPVKKINRVLNANTEQYSLENNLRVIRESKGFKQCQVCNIMKQYDKAFDKSLLSKMENGVCLPTYYQLAKLAHIYGCMPSELINADLYY
jgi:hypothetical protein